MALVMSRTDEKFTCGKSYTFKPLVVTSCIPVGGSRWWEKKFAEGLCVMFEPSKDAYIFLGIPAEPPKPGEEKVVPHYFYVKADKKGRAVGYIPPFPHVRVVK